MSEKKKGKITKKSPPDASKGGAARAKRLSPEERSEFGGASRMVDFATSLAPNVETPNELTARAASLADRLRNPIPFLMPRAVKANDPRRARGGSRTTGKR